MCYAVACGQGFGLLIVWRWEEVGTQIVTHYQLNSEHQLVSWG